MIPVQHDFDALAKALQEGRVKIRFLKVSDGSTREGVFTLNSKLLEEAGWSPKPVQEGVSKPARPPNPALMNVYEVQTGNGWKSFKKENLIAWEPLEG